jgi:hypothetical protein
LALEVVHLFGLDKLAIDDGWLAKVTIYGAVTVRMSLLNVVHALLDCSVIELLFKLLLPCLVTLLNQCLRSFVLFDHFSASSFCLGNLGGLVLFQLL